MRKIVEDLGFYHVSTQCPCVGGGRFYKNNDYPNLKVLLKGAFGIIRKNGVEKFKTNDSELLEKKLKEILQK